MENKKWNDQPRPEEDEQLEEESRKNPIWTKTKDQEYR